MQVEDPDHPVTASHRNFLSRFIDLYATRFFRAQLADLHHAHGREIANRESSIASRTKYPAARLMKFNIEYSRDVFIRSRFRKLDDLDLFFFVQVNKMQTAVGSAGEQQIFPFDIAQGENDGRELGSETRRLIGSKVPQGRNPVAAA